MLRFPGSLAGKESIRKTASPLKRQRSVRFLKSRNQNPATDEELILAYRQDRDPARIGLLFDRYSSLLFGVCMQYLRDEDESKDAVVHLFERFQHDLLKYEVRNFGSWAYRVSRNYCVRLLAKRKEVHDEWALKNLVADEINKEEQLYTELRIEELERAMGMLQVHQRRCIEMFFIQELSYQQISDQTGFSLKQVKSYIQNGKRNLRIRLGGTGHDED